MEIVSLFRSRVRTSWAVSRATADGRPYWLLTHGHRTRDGWQLRLPLSRKQFPAPEAWDRELLLEGDDFYLVPAEGRRDGRGNQLYVIRRGPEAPAGQLVLWHLPPPYRAKIEYRIQGEAVELGRGFESHLSLHGRWAMVPAPLVLVTGPAILSWNMTRWPDGGVTEWSAAFDKKNWSLPPEEEAWDGED